MSNEQLQNPNDRIEFTCIDCEQDIDREPNKMDLPGLTPKRCLQCTLARMSK